MAGVFGRRGEVVWKKAPFVGSGGRRDYDTYLGWGLFVPLYLTEPVHTWGWGQYGNEARAIRLRQDGRFRRNVHLQDTGAMVAFLSGLVVLPMCCAEVHLGLTALTFTLFVAGVTAAVVGSSGKRRDRDIRLLLGKHAWGSSDPATWHKSLLKKVVHPRRLGADSFAELVDVALRERAYREAMWSARLCAAVEDHEEGEALTDDILDLPGVRKRIYRLRADPGSADREFGTVPLTTWVDGDPAANVFSVGG